MTKFKVIRNVLFGLSSFVGMNGMAQEQPMLSDGPYVEAGMESMDYSAIAPSQALDLATPLRFKPVMGVEVGAIWLQRQTPGSFTFITDGSGNPLLNMNQMQGDSGAGLDTKLHFYNLFSDCRALDVEMRYFQASNMTFEQMVNAPQVIPIFFGAPPINPLPTYDVLYESQVRSYESNLVVRTPWRLRFLGGFRYFEAGDDFNIIDPSTDNLVRSRVRNKMGGGQLGTELVLISNSHGKVSGSFKWAGLRNEARGNAVAVDVNNNSVVSSLAGNNNSYLLDFELGGSLAITRSFSVYGGYQGLAAYGVGLSTTQSQNSFLFTPTNPIVFGDTQWHGFKIGLDATF